MEAATTEIAAPSALPEVPRSGTPEYAEWRTTGEIPQPQAESAPATEEKVDTGEATPPKQQEKRRKPDAEARIRELTAKVKELEARTPKAEPAREQPKEQPKVEATRTKPTLDDKTPDGKPKYATYEDWLEDLADWKVEQRDVRREAEQRQKSESEAFQAKLAEAKSRNPDFDDVMNEAMPIIREANLPAEIAKRLNDSEVLPDLMYTLGGDPKELAKFIAMAKNDPGKAREHIAVLERLIADEIVEPKSEARNDKGQFVPKAEAPAKPGPETTPEPPLEVGARASGPMDEEARAVSEMERGNPNAFRQFRDARNAKDARRLRGA
jgi:hypothetical protein